MSDIELLEGMYDFLCKLVPRITPEEKLYFAGITKEYYEDYDEEDDDEWEEEFEDED
jgi:hypothetical protein